MLQFGGCKDFAFQNSDDYVNISADKAKGFLISIFCNRISNSTKTSTTKSKINNK